MQDTSELRLAVLIDAENIPYKNIRGILAEVAKYGTPTLKRIYGDWTNSSLSGWKSATAMRARRNSAAIPERSRSRRWRRHTATSRSTWVISC